MDTFSITISNTIRCLTWSDPKLKLTKLKLPNYLCGSSSRGKKKYGASKLGIWGSFIGLMIGLFAFPPFGMFISRFIEAVAGELFAGKEGEKALRAGWGVFVGNLVSIGLIMGLCGIMLFFYVNEMF